MKKLRIGFSALVAIVAIGLTIAAQAGVFETKAIKALAETDCFDVRNVTGTPPPGVPITVADPTDCDITTVLSEQFQCSKLGTLNWKLFTPLTPSSPIIGNPGLVCPGEAKFCCIKFQRDEEPCDEQEEIDLGNGFHYYKVLQIFCTEQ